MGPIPVTSRRPPKSTSTAGRLVRTALVAVYFLFLGAVFTYPLVKNISRGLPYTHYSEKNLEGAPLIQGDYLQLYYVMWVVKDSLRGPTPFLTDPYQFNVPGIEPPRFSLQELPKSLFYSFYALAVDDLAGYNLLVLSTFIFSGLGMFLLVGSLTGSGWAGLVGGTLYSLFPYRVVHLVGGHPGGFAAHWVPWCLYFLLLAFRRNSGAWAFLAGFCFLALGLDDMNLSYYVLLFLSPLLVLFFFWKPYPVVFKPSKGLSKSRSETLLGFNPATVWSRLKLFFLPCSSHLPAFLLAVFSKGPAAGSVGYCGGAPPFRYPGLCPRVVRSPDPL